MQDNSTFQIPKPTIMIPRQILEKINYFVQKGGSHECSGLGLTRLNGMQIEVIDVFMVKQRNSGATTDMDPEAVNKLMYEQRNAEGQLNFWWHSHADMSVFWSGTDKETINQIGGEGFCVAAVFNKKREMRAALACTTTLNLPFTEQKEVTLFLDELKVVCETPIDEDLKKAWDEEYEKNVQKGWQWNKGGSHDTGNPTRELTRLPYTGTGLGFGAARSMTGGISGTKRLTLQEEADLLSGWHDCWESARHDIDYSTENCQYDTVTRRYRKSQKQILADREFVKEFGRSLPGGHSTGNPSGAGVSSHGDSGIENIGRDRPISKLTADEQLEDEMMKDEVSRLDPNIEDYNPYWNVFIMKDGSMIDCDEYMALDKQTKNIVDNAAAQAEAANRAAIAENKKTMSEQDLENVYGKDRT